MVQRSASVPGRGRQIFTPIVLGVELSHGAAKGTNTSFLWRLSVSEIEEAIRQLASVGADPRGFSGSKMFRCPACSANRRKKHIKCLSVRSDSEGFQFFCHHCSDFKGGYFYDQSSAG